MERIWIIVADAARARIFETTAADYTITEIYDLTQPASQMERRKHRERQKGDAVAKHKASSPSPDHDLASSDKHAESFAKEMGEYLRQARDDNEFTQLVLAAEPQVLGRLRANLDRATAACVTESIGKNWAQHSKAQIEKLVSRKCEWAGQR